MVSLQPALTVEGFHVECGKHPGKGNLAVSKRAICFLVVRVIAIFCWIQCLNYLSETLVFAWAFAGSPGHFRVWMQFLFQALSPVGYFIAGLYLWNKADSIQSKLIPADETDLTTSTPTEPVASYTIATSTIGLFILITAIPQIAGAIASLAALHTVMPIVPPDDQARSTSKLVAGIIQACVGYVVFVKTPAIARLIVDRDSTKTVVEPQ